MGSSTLCDSTHNCITQFAALKSSVHLTATEMVQMQACGMRTELLTIRLYDIFKSNMHVSKQVITS